METTTTHAQLVLDILNEFKFKDRPATAIRDYVANNIYSFDKVEAGAYGEAQEIASAIYNKGTRVGYKNGVETTFQDIAELKDKLL